MKNYIEENDVTIVQNSGDCKTHWTVEVSTKFSKKEAEIFYQYISLYHNYRRKLTDRGRTIMDKNCCPFCNQPLEEEFEDGTGYNRTWICRPCHYWRD